MTSPTTAIPPSEPDHIAISKSRGVKVDWKDGHHSDYTVGYLRDNCPCATCTGAHGTTPEKTNYSTPAAAGPFPMFKPALRMNEVEEVGHYAIRIVWSDGHSAGIYSFDHLRRICPCDACAGRQAG